MKEVDADHTAYLKKLLAEVGWIDVERFGKQAAGAAFLIVQHSGDLRLRLTVLPRIRDDAGELGAAQDYALLYDRTRLQLGEKQVYGSEVLVSPEGGAHVQPLEDPESVDRRRRDIGLPPLGEYLAQLRELYGLEGEIPIREDF